MPFKASNRRLLVPAVLVAALGISQWGCGNLDKVEGKSPESGKAEQPGLFTIPPEQIQHLQIVPVQKRTWSVAIRTTGTVDWDADHTTQAITQVNGPIARILVDTGSRVQAGEPLLYVSSPDVANAISTYRKARNRQLLTERVLNRMKELLEHGSVARKDVDSSEADYNDASTDVETSLQALKIFGITKQEIDRADRQGTPISTELAVRAPIAGTVVQKLVSPGQLIQAGSTVCFMISNTSTVWVQGHIFDRDLPSVRVGDVVEETNPSLPRAFRGRVAYIGAFVDPATRTTPVRIVTQNPDGILKKDTYVEAVIHTGTRNDLLAIPVSAVLRDDKNEPIAYVEAQPGKFAQRSLVVGAQQDGMVAVTSGLQEGEKVVSDGSLFLQFSNAIQ